MKKIKARVVNTHENIRKLYSIYTPEFFKNHKINKAIPNKVLRAYFKKVKGYVLEGYVVHLPLSYGTIAVEGYRPPVVTKIPNGHGGYRLKGLTINWGKTRDLWEVDKGMLEKKQCVYNTNEATDGFQYKLVLNRNTRYKKGTRFYTSSKMKIAIKEIIQSGNWQIFPRTLKQDVDFVKRFTTEGAANRMQYRNYLESINKNNETN